jgi:3-deoxy-D-manno-octulosonic-acid transferase
MLTRILYTLLLLMASPLLIYTLYKQRPDKPSIGSRWKEHWGITPTLNNHSKKVIWVHAVSVGETIAVTPFLRELKRQHPELSLLITTTTATGAEQASKLADIAEHRYMPFDFPWMIERFIATVSPSQLIIMETELWPNTLYVAKKRGIPVHVINARLSQRSCQRYKKIPTLFKQVIGCIDHISCQYQHDADHFLELGVPKHKLSVCGSIKFDLHLPPSVFNTGNALRAQLGTERLVWIAASTHQGEDEIILSAHHKVLEQYPDALLILVPRHPERFNDVFRLANQHRFSTVRRSQTTASTTLTAETAATLVNSQVYVGDTMGEMLVLIQAADICFMGGSLLGNKVGGHNVIEPAALSKPILNGPSYFNFKEITENLVAHSALRIVHNQHDLAHSLCEWYANPQLRHQMATNAAAVHFNNQGSIARTLSSLAL